MKMKWGKQAPGEFIIFMGKYKGMRLDDLSLKGLDTYLGWIEGVTLPSKGLEEIGLRIRDYLFRSNIASELERELPEGKGE